MTAFGEERPRGEKPRRPESVPIGETGAATVRVFCDAAERALEELAQSGLTLTVGGALKDGKIRSLWADRVPLVVDGEQRVHLVPSQSWEER